MLSALSGDTKLRCQYKAVKEDLTCIHTVIADARLEESAQEKCASLGGAPVRAEPVEGEMSTRTSHPTVAILLPAGLPGLH